MVSNYKEERIVSDDEVIVYELDFVINVGADGALFEGKVIHDYNKVRSHLLDSNVRIEKVWVESRKIHIVEIKEPLQRNTSKVEVIKVNNGEGYNFPIGHLIAWDVEQGGIRVKVKLIDLYQTQGRTVRALIKHGMVGVMPIIRRGVITGLGVIISSPVKHSNW